MKPKVVMCNIFPKVHQVREIAIENGFTGIDWSFDLEQLPETPLEESNWAREQAILSPFEVRYHCPFYQIDLGHDDPSLAAKAEAVFHRIIRLVSKVRGRYLSIHIGLGSSEAGTASQYASKTWHGDGPADPICLRN